MKVAMAIKRKRGIVDMHIGLFYLKMMWPAEMGQIPGPWVSFS